MSGLVRKGETKHDAQLTKRTLMQFADNTDPDQPAHSRRLIWAFVFRILNQWILYNISTTGNA